MSGQQGQRRGATLTGYGLIVGLIAIVGLVATTNIGSSVNQLFGDVSDRLGGVAGEQPSGPAATPTAVPDDGAPDVQVGSVVIDTSVTFQDVTSQVLALFDDADTPLVITLAANGDDSCVTAVQFDNGSARLSSAVSPCSGSFQVVVEDAEGNSTPFTTLSVTVSSPSVQTSCAGYLSANPSASSGSYSIDPDGSGGSAPFTVFCDMENNGGGWVRCASILDDTTNNTTGLTWLTTNYTGNTDLSVSTPGNFCHGVSFGEVFAEARRTTDTVRFRTGAITAGASLFQNDNGGVRAVSGNDVVATYTRSSHTLNYHDGTSCVLVNNSATQGHHICVGTGTEFQSAFGDINRSHGNARGINMCNSNSGCGKDTANVIMIYAR